MTTTFIPYGTDATSGQLRPGISSDTAAINISGTAAGSGTVNSVSVVSANGLQGSVANATTTPAITLSSSLATGVIPYINSSGAFTTSGLTADGSGNLTALNGFNVDGGFYVGGFTTFGGVVSLEGPLWDGTGSPGTNTYILSSTGSATKWITAPSGVNAINGLSGSVSLDYYNDLFVANGSTKTFSLTQTPISNGSVAGSLNGNVAINGTNGASGYDFTVSGNVVTFAYNPASNTKVYFQYPFLNATPSGPYTNESGVGLTDESTNQLVSEN